MRFKHYLYWCTTSPSKPLFLLLFIFLSLIIQTSLAQPIPDLCGGNKDFDLHTLHFSQPWKVTKIFTGQLAPKKTFFEIHVCQNFTSNDNSIPNECINKSICQHIDDNKHIGYLPISFGPSYETYQVKYVGPYCPEESKNYTIDIRFICGNNLGYPSYPPNSIDSKCSTILHWETSAICKGSSSERSFGLNERPCYVIDDKGRRRDLTPLIRHSQSYKVWSADSTDMFINVCTDAVDQCGNDSSACIKTSSGVSNTKTETIGSYKWSSIDFHKANAGEEHDFVKLSYKTKDGNCKSIVNPEGETVTSIRFRCPNNQSFPRRYPVLISDLDCHYEIEWQTDFACPQSEITSTDVDCHFEDIDFNNLYRPKNYQTDNVIDYDGNNVTIKFNICGSISKSSNNGCSDGASVCIVKKNSNDKPLELKRRNAKFMKVDNRITLTYTSTSPICKPKGSNNSRYLRTTIEFECDSSSENSHFVEPQFIGIEDCIYMYKWRNHLTCNLLSPPNCAYRNEAQGFNIDLSSLTLFDNQYTVERYQPEPKYYFLLPSKAEIYINVCGNLATKPKSKTEKCVHSSACLIDNHKNITINMGRFRESLTYNSDLKAIQLLYTDGWNPLINKSMNTLINFHCESWSHDNKPYLMDYNEYLGLYTIEFGTPAACPLQTVIGKDCMVTDPMNERVYDLNQLKAKQYYPVKYGSNYEFEINVCGPIRNGSCGDGVAICQRELNGQRRSFVLGRHNSLVSFWNTMVNMTFINGTPYNDADRTPRKSHISFLCDPKAGTGHPQFDGEKNRSYFFRWYTSLACPGPAPKITNCIFENATHYFDLTPLSMERGNHFYVGMNRSIVYINFCRPLNKLRDNLLGNCKSNSGICMVNFSNTKAISLGEPHGHPFMGFDGGSYMIYTNGDRCRYDQTKQITSRVRFVCNLLLGDDVAITFIDPNEEPLEDGNRCTYEFIVRTKYACAQSISAIGFDHCTYTDTRTNLSADLHLLTKRNGDYQTGANNGPNSHFTLNICKAVQSNNAINNNQCQDAAACFRAANNSYVNYGRADSPKLYLKGNNLHLRYTNGSKCDNQLDNRSRSADIEFICDHTAHSSKPTLIFQNDCHVMFEWKTSVVCNLIIPSCSLVDETTGNYYTLRPLSSLSHAWNVSGPHGSHSYLINVCKALPLELSCGPSSAACRCYRMKDGTFSCDTNIGKTTDHELILDSHTNDLLLSYDDGEQICEGTSAQTQIRFRCSIDDGLSGPKFIEVQECVHYFEWNTSYACSRQNIYNNSIHLSIDSDYVVHDQLNQLQWPMGELFRSKYNVSEPNRNEKYEYVFDFAKSTTEQELNDCHHSAICQTKQFDTFKRDIGTIGHWNFKYIGNVLYMVIQSNHSICGRTKRSVTSSIVFDCSESDEIGHPQFLYESEDCDYFFTWETHVACDMIRNRQSLVKISDRRSTNFSIGWIIFSLAMFSLIGFAGWLFISSSSKRDDVVFYLRRLFRRNVTPQMPIRYQQLSK